MAEATTVQKSRLDAERQALRARVRRFREQISRDREALGEEASRLVGAESPMARHPKTLVGVSAGVGLALGLAPTKVPVPDVPAPPALAGKAATAGFDALKVEAGVVLRDILDGAFGTAKDHADDLPPEVLRQRQLEAGRGGD